MQHLDTDRLAALADEAPTAAEAEHIATCVACRGERDAYVALLDLARREGTATSAAAPLTSWDAISAALRDEGLVRASPGGTSAPATVTRFRVQPLRTTAAFWRRAAASVALLVGGAAVGRVTAPAAAAASGPAAQVATTTVEAPPAASPGASPAATAARSVGLSDTLPVAGEPRARLASNQAGASDFSGTGDAMQALARAQQEYQRAAAYLAEHDSGTVAGSPQILRARLAALDEVMPKVREALYEAPQDPVLNQYYITTSDVRESTLRQLGRALPVNMRLSAY
ncbi:MAG: hypothetical protein JO180_09920 [Gemmatirosa sp.]|nr:hypothetical protein [Gemmatirosa sp.]